MLSKCLVLEMETEGHVKSHSSLTCSLAVYKGGVKALDL